MKKLLSILAVCGLTATTSTAAISCGKGNKPAQIKAQVEVKNPQKTIEVKLTKTYPGQRLNKEDQVLVQNTVINALKEANQDVVVEKDTFTVLGLAEMKTDVKKISIQVKETKSTVDKAGLKGGEISVSLTLVPLDKISLTEIGTQSFKWELGKDKTEELAEFVANLIKQFTNDKVRGYLIKGNITGSPKEVGTSIIVEAKESATMIKDSFEVVVKLDISDLKSWWTSDPNETKVRLTFDETKKATIIAFISVSVPGKPIFGKDYEFDGENFKSGDEIIIRSKEGSKCFLPGKSFTIVV